MNILVFVLGDAILFLRILTPIPPRDPIISANKELVH